jgi:hypothetical protein
LEVDEVAEYRKEGREKGKRVGKVEDYMEGYDGLDVNLRSHLDVRAVKEESTHIDGTHAYSLCIP